MTDKNGVTWVTIRVPVIRDLPPERRCGLKHIDAQLISEDQRLAYQQLVWGLNTIRAKVPGQRGVRRPEQDVRTGPDALKWLCQAIATAEPEEQPTKTKYAKPDKSAAS